MQIVKDIWDGLALIGLMTVIYGVIYAYQRFRRVLASAEKSNQRFQEQATSVKSVSADLEALGVETSPPPEFHSR